MEYIPPAIAFSAFYDWRLNLALFIPPSLSVSTRGTRLGDLMALQEKQYQCLKFFSDATTHLGLGLVT